MSEFWVWPALYHKKPTFKRTRNFTADNFWNLGFYALLTCDFVIAQTHAVPLLCIEKSSHTETVTSPRAGARFSSARPPKCTPKFKFTFSNIISYQSERSFDEKSHFQAYKAHEASFSNFTRYTVNVTVSKTVIQITAVDEFDVIKK